MFFRHSFDADEEFTLRAVIFGTTLALFLPLAPHSVVATKEWHVSYFVIRSTWSLYLDFKTEEKFGSFVTTSFISL